MPLITVKVFEGELTWDQTTEMIENITQAVIPYVGEAVRSNTWVIVEEIKSGSWGIGGKAFGLPDLRQIQHSAPPDQRPYSRASGVKPADRQSCGHCGGLTRMTNETLDNDLEQLAREDIVAEVRRLRAGIRRHRDSSGHELCWHHPQLWDLLPEKSSSELAVPEWPQFLRGCVEYRESLDQQLPDAPRVTDEFELAARPDDSQDAGRSRNAMKPPFTQETARRKVQAAEDAWNTRDPDRVALGYSEDSEWRNRTEFLKGRDEIRAFLRRKWAKELDYRLKKTLWGFRENRIAVSFEYEWHDASGQWFRSYGNELWEFDQEGLMCRRIASINDSPIDSSERRIH